jgi:streptomycin 6-kinase
LTDPDLLEPHLALWALTPEAPPVQTQTSVVQLVRRGAERLVLKLITHADEAGQRAALAHFGGRGAVRLVDWDGTALLMERAQPGEQLVRLVRGGRDDEATVRAGEVMARLQAQSAPPPAGLRTVESWGRAFARTGPLAIERGVEPGLIDRAEASWAELSASQGPRVLLHGDLQHYNILSDARRGWLAIDPKGVVGEPAFEPGALLRNPVGELRLYASPQIIARRTALLCERLVLDPRRVLAWAFSQAVLSALWSIEDGGEPGQGVAMARACLPLL